MSLIKHIILLFSVVIITILGLGGGTAQEALALNWTWSYTGVGIEAKGTLTTNDTPNDLGFYLITEIKGKRNKKIITGLHKTGTPIPGDEPFKVDNLISLNPHQLTSSGLGFSTSEGNFISLFFAEFLNPPGYLEVFSASPFIKGFENLGTEDSELKITFKATPITLP